MSTEKKQPFTTISVRPETKLDLESNLPWGKKETWDEKLRTLKERQIPEEVYTPLANLIETANNPELGEPLFVSSLIGQVLGKLGMALGVSNSPNLLDWGIGKTMGAKVVLFGQTDQFSALTMLAVGSLQRLAKKFDIPELLPLIDQIRDIVVNRAAKGLNIPELTEETLQ